MLVTDDLDAALDVALEARAAERPLAVALIGGAAELQEGLLARDVIPDVVTDLTAAHDLRSGYLPSGVTLEQAAALRQGDPGKLEALALTTLVRHVRAMLQLRARGAVTFDYGNNIRPHAASGGLAEALDIDIFTARYLRPLFCRGIGPFRWICLSGDDQDLELIDELCLELFAGVDRITDWIGLARAHVTRQGLPARIAWLGHGERTRLGLAVNQAVAAGRLHAPVAFTRDHMDGGAMTHPNIITEGMADGSDAISDWPLLNALLGTASGADLVALHAGGGGYAGYSQSAGMTVVATGSADAAARLQASLHVDTALGVLRHADAGYPEAIDAAREHGLGLGSARRERVVAMRELDLRAVHAAVAGGSVLAAGGGGWVDHGLLVGSTAVQYGTPRLATLDEIEPRGDAGHGERDRRPGGGGLGDATRRLCPRAAAADGCRAGADRRHRHGPERVLHHLQRLGRLGGSRDPGDRCRRRRPRPSHRQDGVIRARRRRRLPDRPGRGRWQPGREPLPRGGGARHCAPHGGRAADRRGPVGRLHLRRAQPPSRLVRGRARRRRRDQLRDRPGRGDPGRRARGTATDDRRHRRRTWAGAIIAEGPVRRRQLRTENAFDIGTIEVGELELGFVNEYLTADSGGERLATFPDVLATLSPGTGRIISIADIRRAATRSRSCTSPRPRCRSATASRSRVSTPRWRRCSASPWPSTRLPDDQRIAERLEALWEIALGAGWRRRPPRLLPGRGRGDAAGGRLGGRSGARAGIDRHGNLWALPDGWSGPLVTSGSHLDTVPDGGRYDGALGTVLGLELAHDLPAGAAGAPALACWSAPPRRPPGSERARSARACLSVRCPQTALRELRDERGVTAAQAQSEYLKALSPLPRVEPPVARLRGHVEVHVAQRRALRELGVVTRVASPRRFEVAIEGAAGHCGEISMEDRHDALAAAAELVLAVEAAARAEPPETVATVGTLVVSPGAVSVIPGLVRLAIDVRAIDSDSLARLDAAIRAAANDIAARRRVRSELRLTRGGRAGGPRRRALAAAAMRAAAALGIDAPGDLVGRRP